MNPGYPLAYRLAVGLTLLMVGCGDSGPASDAYGHIEATDILISAETAGTVWFAGPGEGEMVDSGAVLVRIDTTAAHLRRAQFRAQTEGASARLQQVDAQEAILNEQVATIGREIDRIGALREGGAATAKQAEDLDAQLRVMRRQVEALWPQKTAIRAEIDAIRAQSALNEDQIGRATVRSPLSATVLNRYVEPGEFVTVGKPLYRLADLRMVTMRAYISGDQLPDIAIGQPAILVVDGGGGTYREFEGIVARIADRAEFTPRNLQTREDRVNFVYAIEIRVPNDGTLKIGMPAEVRFP